MARIIDDNVSLDIFSFKNRYPKIGVVISADYDKLVQLPPGSKIKFKEIDLASAELLFKLYQMETMNLVSKIK